MHIIYIEIQFNVADEAHSQHQELKTFLISLNNEMFCLGQNSCGLNQWTGHSLERSK